MLFTPLHFRLTLWLNVADCVISLHKCFSPAFGSFLKIKGSSNSVDDGADKKLNSHDLNNTFATLYSCI